MAHAARESDCNLSPATSVTCCLSLHTYFIETVISFDESRGELKAHSEMSNNNPKTGTRASWNRSWRSVGVSRAEWANRDQEGRIEG
jgi:hypothetical protein